MILAFDSYYYGTNKAKTVCLVFEDWISNVSYKVYTEILENVSEYISGQFYKRELPCIISLLDQIKKDNIAVDFIIVDGYVYLDDSKKLGLGGHLYYTLNEEIPIIGVAKTKFSFIDNLKVDLLRGESKIPLYITSIGIPLQEASQSIHSMHGKFRMPTLLKEMDRLTKEPDMC